MRTILFQSAFFRFVGASICLAVDAGLVPLHGHPGEATNAARVAKLIRQLGDEAFEKRVAASKELETIGEPALDALGKAAASDTDPEVRKRAAQIMQAVKGRIRAAIAKKELAKWQGAWESKDQTFYIKDDRWYWVATGAKPAYADSFTIVEVRDKMVLADLLIGEAGHPRRGETVKAIFQLDGDTLQYCGTYDLPRPTEMVKNRSDPYYVAWVRVKR